MSNPLMDELGQYLFDVARGNTAKQQEALRAKAGTSPTFKSVTNADGSITAVDIRTPDQLKAGVANDAATINNLRAQGVNEATLKSAFANKDADLATARNLKYQTQLRNMATPSEAGIPINVSGDPSLGKNAGQVDAWAQPTAMTQSALTSNLGQVRTINDTALEDNQAVQDSRAAGTIAQNNAPLIANWRNSQVDVPTGDDRFAYSPSDIINSYSIPGMTPSPATLLQGSTPTQTIEMSPSRTIMGITTPGQPKIINSRQPAQVVPLGAVSDDPVLPPTSTFASPAPTPQASQTNMGNNSGYSGIPTTQVQPYSNLLTPTANGTTQPQVQPDDQSGGTNNLGNSIVQGLLQTRNAKQSKLRSLLGSVLGSSN